MAGKIQYTDLVEAGISERLVKEFKEAEAGIKRTVANIKKEVAGIKVNLMQAGDSKELIKAMKDAENVTKKYEAELKKLKITQDQLRSAEDQLKKAQSEQNVELQQYKIKTAEANREAKLLAQTQTAQKGSINELKAETNRLTNEMNKLNLETKEGREEFQRLQTQIKQNNEKLKQFDAQIGRHQRNVGNYKSALSGVTKALGVFGVALGGAAIIGMFRNSAKAFDTQAKAVAKVGQAIKSTAGAAGLSLARLANEATRLQQETLFGDEEILNSATAQLLTFTNIVGDNFLRTQRAAMDIATVLGGDLQSSAIQLGKALNDPVANLSALSRSGIQFSKDQKEVINSLVESNRLFDAQTIILDELERQYGGQAKTAAEVGTGAFKQLGNVIADNMEIMGESIVKALNPFAQALLNIFDTSKSNTEILADERNEVNLLTIQLSNANTPQEKRAEIYAKLKEIAPDVVAGIDQENINVGKLNENLRIYNDLQVKKIALASTEEVLQEKRERLAAKINDRLTAENELMQGWMTVRDEYGKYQNDGIAGLDEMLTRYDNLLTANIDINDKGERLKKLQQEINKTLNAGNIITQKYTNDLYNLAQARAEEEEATRAVEGALSEYEDRYNRIVASGGTITPTPTITPTEGGTGDGSKKAVAEQETLDVLAIIEDRNAQMQEKREEDAQRELELVQN